MAKNKLQQTEITQTGFQSPAGDYIDHRIDLNAQLVAHPSATFLFRSDDSARHPAGVYKGDILVVDRSVSPRNDDLLIVASHGELLLKRLVIRRGERFLADETGGKINAVSADPDTTIWGVVVYVIHCTRRGSVA